MSVTEALSALALKLAAVAPVRTGRGALETTSAALPVITVWSRSDALAAEQDYDYPTYARSAVIEYKASAGDDYQPALDAALVAIRAALEPDADGRWLGGSALMLRQEGATFSHPVDGGDAAVIQISITLDYAGA